MPPEHGADDRRPEIVVEDGRERRPVAPGSDVPFCDGGAPVDDEHLGQQGDRADGEDVRGRRPAGIRAAGIERPARPERQEASPEEEEPEKRIIARADEEVPELERCGEEPEDDGRERRSMADEERQRRGRGDREEDRLAPCAPAGEVKAEGPGVEPAEQREQVGAGKHARVRVVGTEVAGADGEVDQNRERQPDAENRERAEVGSEELGGTRLQSAAPSGTPGTARRIHSARAHADIPVAWYR